MMMSDIRTTLAGQVIQGLLERDTGWASKTLDDVFYEKLAKHTVKIVDALIIELEGGKKEKMEAPNDNYYLVNKICSWLRLNIDHYIKRKHDESNTSFEYIEVSKEELIEDLKRTIL